MTNSTQEQERALALYEQSEVGLDLWPTAVDKLEKFVASPEAPPALRFNLARLLLVRPRPTEARGYWNRLAETAGELPAPIQALVCQEQSGPAAAVLPALLG